MHLNTAGRVVERTWDGLPNRFPTLALDAFVVMPNHIHGIVCLVGAGLALPSRDSDVLAPPSLSHVVGAFKSLGAIAANRALSRPGRPLWQRNYFEHIIRNDNALRRIREYIATNPARWAFDGENPDRSGDDEFDRWLSDRADAQR